MSLERELAALNRRLNDLKRRVEDLLPSRPTYYLIENRNHND